MWGTGLLKNVHATILKGNMGYDQYTVPDTAAVEPTFIAFRLALANIRPWPLVSFFLSFIFSKNSELKITNNTFRVVACTLSDNFSRNSCIYFRLGVIKPSFLLIYFRYGPNTRPYYNIGWQRTYPIREAPLSRPARRSFAPLRKLRWNHRSYVWTETPSGMIFVPAQNLSGILRLGTCEKRRLNRALATETSARKSHCHK